MPILGGPPDEVLDGDDRADQPAIRCGVHGSTGTLLRVAGDSPRTTILRPTSYPPVLSALGCLGVAVLIAATGSPIGWVIASLLAAVTAAIMAPMVRLGPEGLSARNVWRRRRWPWTEIQRIEAQATTLPFFQAMGFSKLVVVTEAESFGLSASTGMSERRAAALLQQLRSFDAVVDERIRAEWFPVRNRREAMEDELRAAAEEREAQAAVYQRLDQARSEGRSDRP